MKIGNQDRSGKCETTLGWTKKGDKMALMQTARRYKFLTQEELKRLLQVIEDRRDRAIIITAYRYGLRASEVCAMRREEVAFDRNTIQIRRLKGSLSREYPLDAEVRRSLKGYLRKRKDDHPALFLSQRKEPLTRSGLDKMIKRYAEMAQLPQDKRHFHCLKHSIATHLLDAGAQIMFVRDWLGHRNIQNTLIYAQLTAGTLEGEAQKVFSSRKIVS